MSPLRNEEAPRQLRTDGRAHKPTYQGQFTTATIKINLAEAFHRALLYATQTGRRLCAAPLASLLPAGPPSPIDWTLPARRRTA